MDNSVTFMVNHQGMPKGIYLARKDEFNGSAVITLDIRIKRPYADEVMTAGEMHTLEHSFATCVRDEAASLDDLKVLYFGPMGCATGFYLLLMFDARKTDFLGEVCRLLIKAVSRMDGMDKVPAANRYQCGNYTSLTGMDTARALAGEIAVLAGEALDKGCFHPYSYLTEESLAALLAE